jgi:hypothetical protein
MMLAAVLLKQDVELNADTYEIVNRVQKMSQNDMRDNENLFFGLSSSMEIIFMWNNVEI